MSTEKLYRDSDGNERTLLAMCRHEPEWAASRIRHMLDQIDALRAAQPSAQELEALRVLRETAVALVAAADACDREAERHPSSRSSAPMARYVNAMARLRALLAPDEVSRG